MFERGVLARSMNRAWRWEDIPLACYSFLLGLGFENGIEGWGDEGNGGLVRSEKEVLGWEEERRR